MVTTSLKNSVFKKFGENVEKLSFQDILDILNTTPKKYFPESKHIHWCYNLDNPNKV